MELFIGVIIGVVGDLLRSILAPASTEAIARVIPGLRQEKNLEDNRVMLELMAKLKELGKDPALARHAKEDTERFMELLEAQTDSFVEFAIEVIDSSQMTQGEMTAEAGRRARVARQYMEDAMAEVLASPSLDAQQATDLQRAQKAWEAYASAHAKVEGGTVRGGTLEPHLINGAMEDLALARASELKKLAKSLQYP